MPDGEAISGEGQLPKPFISDKCYDDGRLLPEHVIESNGTVTLTEKGRLQVIWTIFHIITPFTPVANIACRIIFVFHKILRGNGGIVLINNGESPKENIVSFDGHPCK